MKKTTSRTPVPILKLHAEPDMASAIGTWPTVQTPKSTLTAEPSTVNTTENWPTLQAPKSVLTTESYKVSMTVICCSRRRE